MSKCGNNLIHELFRSLIFQFRSTYQPKTAPISSSSVSSHRWHGGQHLRAVGHVHSRLILALHQRGAISTCVGMAIYLRHFVVNLASLEGSSLQRSSPFSRCNSARLKGAHSFLAPRRSRPLGLWTSVTDYLFLVIKSMTTGAEQSSPSTHDHDDHDQEPHIISIKQLCDERAGR